MRRVLVTASARRDLNDIWDFIARDSVDAADRVIATIRSEFQKLAEHPGFGHTREELDPVYRVWSVYSYLVIYRPDTRPIQITRVIHGHRDLDRLSF